MNMKEQVEKAMPLVEIVMATYNPRMDWFKEQLESLNKQTYQNIKLSIIDDCSNKTEFEDIKKCVEKEITNFPYTIHQNPENLGSNKTFELLTQQAGGEYIAYCDQDDIWIEDKIEKLKDFIENTKSKLVCSDVYIIDESGRLKADSITKVRKRHRFKEGEGLAESLLFKNFVIGCTMLIKTKTAKESLPFVEDMVHDHYLAFYAATKGRISIYKENLIKYRIHGQNQTNVLAGVKSKEDYYNIRIKPYLRRMEEINERFSDIPKAKEALEWARARDGYFKNKAGCGKRLWRFRNLNVTTTVYELVMVKMPILIFNMSYRLIQKGIL